MRVQLKQVLNSLDKTELYEQQASTKLRLVEDMGMGREMRDFAKDCAKEGFDVEKTFPAGAKECEEIGAGARARAFCGRLTGLTEDE